jgi:SAM-dependent methyltransferase
VELQCLRLIDIGCGAGSKLVRFAGDLETIDLDYGANIELCRRSHPGHRWIEYDIDSGGDLPIEPEELRRAIVLSADVVEHLVKPELLLRQIRAALAFAEAAVISTPDRDLTWGPDHTGPPPNPAHVREWTTPEFAAFLASEGFRNAELRLVESNDQGFRLKTILATLRPG